VPGPSRGARPRHLSDRAGYRVGADVAAAEGAGAGEPPMTTGRFAHAESPVSSVINASPSTTDFTCVLMTIPPSSSFLVSVSRNALLPP
jgi:hypothetical protein